jgi:hypothetical protein
MANTARNPIPSDISVSDKRCTLVNYRQFGVRTLLSRRNQLKLVLVILSRLLKGETRTTTESRAHPNVPNSRGYSPWHPRE